MSAYDERHIGRSFMDTHLEDACPCPKEPCGLVRIDKISEKCEQHGFGHAKTIRQSHLEERCPGKR